MMTPHGFRTLVEEDLEAACKAISKSHEPGVNAYVYPSPKSGRQGENVVVMSQLQARRDAPRGVGTAFMHDLCVWADRMGLMICLQTAHRGDFNGDDRTYKVTSSGDRLKTFYRRFGFVYHKSKRCYRPDLPGNMHRKPQGSA